MAKTNNRFFYQAAASRDYGFTAGARDAGEISLTELGRQAVYPSSPESEYEARLKGFLSIDVFEQVVLHFGGSKLPEMQYLSNTLETEFNIDKEYHQEFVEIFSKNARYLGIGATWDPSTRTPAKQPDDVGSESVTIATPPDSDGDGRVCFVIMPFTERQDDHAPGFFEEVLNQLFTPAATDAGFEVKTSLRQGSDMIQSTIVNDLLNADLVLADLTEHNPNVLFELGMRMAADKPVVLVRAKGTGAIFDVDNMLRVAEYDPNVWPSTVDTDVATLANHIRAGWEYRDDGNSYLGILRRTS